MVQTARKFVKTDAWKDFEIEAPDSPVRSVIYSSPNDNPVIFSATIEGQWANHDLAMSNKVAKVTEDENKRIQE